MDGVVSEYPNVRQQAEHLGLQLHTGIVILPRGFHNADLADDLAHEADASTLRKLLQQEGLEVCELQPAEGRLPAIIERDAYWIAPVIFMASDLITLNPDAITTVLKVIQSYVMSVVMGKLKGGQIEMTFVAEVTPNRKYKKFEFKGTPSRITEVAELLRELNSE